MNSPLRSIRLATRIGAAHDPRGKEGLANLTAQMMVKGATRSRGYKQILEECFEMATHIEAQVDKELTVFHAVYHQDHHERFQTLLLEMRHQPAFLPEDFERVRQDQINFLEFTLGQNNDEELAKETLYSKLYADHPYEHHCVGTVDGLRNITLDDVRAFHPLVLQEHAPLALPSPRQPVGRQITRIHKPDARAIAISFGWHIPVVRGHADFPPLLMAQCWLGQHRSGGRLFDVIREERGLNYGDYAYIEYFPRGMYQLEPDPNLARQQQIFQVWIRPVAPEDANLAISLALHEIEQLAAHGMNDEDFERTRNFLCKHSKLLLKTQSLMDGDRIDSAFYGTPSYPDYLDATLASLTPAHVHSAARRYLDTANLHLVAVGPNLEQISA
jgi:zinc protease